MDLVITDRPGVISVEKMRELFELSIAQTDVLQRNACLDVMPNKQGLQYADRETDTLWIGFALGLRCGERIARAKGGRHEHE